MTQGQSLSTIDKGRQIGAMYAMDLQIVRRRCPGEKFHCFDLNAGCGWNWRFQVPGTPLVFVDAAERILGNCWEAWFYEIDPGRAAELAQRLNGIPRCHVLAEDNVGFVRVAERLPWSALGSVLVDPNGWLYRKPNGEGCPITEMARFFAHHRRMDFLANLNMRTFRLMEGAAKHNLAKYREFCSLRELPALFQKRHGLVSNRSSNGHSEFIRVILRNIPTRDYRAMGWNYWQTLEKLTEPPNGQGKLEFDL
jgi:hypothetical protein